MYAVVRMLQGKLYSVSKFLILISDTQKVLLLPGLELHVIQTLFAGTVLTEPGLYGLYVVW